MIHDYTEIKRGYTGTATQVWFGYFKKRDSFRPEGNGWYFDFLAPSWWTCIITVPQRVDDGNEYIIDKDCAILFSGGTVWNRGNEYRLTRYGNKNHLTIKIIRK